MSSVLSWANEASRDIQRSKIKGKWLDDELDKYRLDVEAKGIESEYQHFLRRVLDQAKINVSHKRKRGNVYIDCDGVNDPSNVVNRKADAQELNQMYKGHLYQMPGRRYNRVTENLSGQHCDQVRSREKEKIYLQQLRKGKNVIGEDGAKTKTVARSNVQRLHQKARQMNNRPIQYQHVDRAQSVEKHKEKMCSKFKGRNMVKVERKTNKKVEVLADNVNLHQGRRNNDRQPGKKVGQGKHQMTAFENYSVKKVKKDPDDGVKTQLRKKEVHNRIRSVEAAYGKDVVNGRRKLMKVGQGNRGLSHQPVAFGNYSVKNEPDESRSVKTSFGKDVVNCRRKLMKVGQGDRGNPHQQAAFGNYYVKNESDEDVKTRLHTKEVQSKISSVKTRKCLVTCKKGLEMIKGNNDPEVEILDSAAIIGGMLTPFEPSKTYNELPVRGCTSTLDEFRKELLEVLNKPYDEDECNKHRETIKIGSYYKYYPDLEKKLRVHRYKRKKCLTILRGFVFWLQNVAREGAFKPWKDRECLAVEPASP